MIWAIFVAFSIAAVGLVLFPLKTSKNSADRRDLAHAIFVDQLQEIERDERRELISAEDAQAARAEISRNILRLAKEGQSEQYRSGKLSRLGIILAALFVPALAFGYYAQFGNPGIESLSSAALAAEREERASMLALANRLEGELREHPEGGPTEGWMLLGQTFLRLQDYERAAQAFEVASTREDAVSETFSMLAEALVYTESGIVIPRAKAALESALELDPLNPAATYYAALHDEQSGRPVAALDALVARLEKADGYYPWMDIYVAEGNRIAASLGRDPITLAQFAPMLAPGGPTAADVAAAQDMSEEDRAAFIASMVQRLASRLEEEPDDLDGWLRLGNAYVVLGRPADAQIAADNAARLLADAPTDPRQEDLAALQQAIKD